MKGLISTWEIRVGDIVRAHSGRGPIHNEKYVGGFLDDLIDIEIEVIDRNKQTASGPRVIGILSRKTKKRFTVSIRQIETILRRNGVPL